ncbi:ankyrin repeat domain-containing protein [Bacillus cereus]|nr:ankyrin repeat domain-containing protein [Bacillus cereus]
MFKKTLSMICCVIFLQGCSQKQEVKKEMTNMETALLAATEKNETNTVISLLKQGANINATDNQGRTPLMIATYKNDVKTARALITAGADINIPDNDGVTPLEHARAHHFEEIEKILLEGNK